MSRAIPIRMPNGTERELTSLDESELREYCDNLAREIQRAIELLQALGEYAQARFGVDLAAGESLRQ